MRPRKTDKAHAALRERPADVSAFERRILIVSDGQRDLRDLVGLLGPDTPTALRRLLHDGYLDDADAAVPARASTAARVSHTASATSAAAPAAETQAARAPPSSSSSPPSAPAAAAASRRSLAVAKIYVLDMLQLQRGADAAAVSTALRACREPDDVAAQLLHALAHLHASTNASYSRRVAERLGEVLPDTYLPAFAVFRDSLFENSDAAA